MKGAGLAALQDIERCYDAIPRVSPDRVRVEELGPLRLFVRVGPGFPFYSRPAAPGVAVTVAQVAAAAERMAELGVPVAFEWVHELVPDLSGVAHAAGLTVRHCPLLLLDPDALPAGPPAGIGVRLVDPDDVAAIVAGEVVAATAFGMPAPVAAPDPDRLEAIVAALRQGHAARAVAWLDDADLQRGDADPPRDASGRPAVLAAGSTQRAAGLAEVVGVGTLPQARRRGLGGAITAALARHELGGGLGSGARAVFLSAADDAASRVYQRVGFRRIGTAVLAAPSPQA